MTCWAIVSSLTEVEPEKPLGCLPLYTLRDVLQIDPIALAREAEAKGLCCAMFEADDCCIKSGALYLFDRPALDRIIQASAATLLSNGWTVDTDQFVARIAREWVEPTHPVAPVIRQAFGERTQGRSR
jgi:hypothetical protein